MERIPRAIPPVLAEAIRKSPLCQEKVAFAWREAVGPAVDRVTRVTLDANGVLQVRATDAHWAREVKRSARLILPRLHRLLGDGVVKRMTTSAS